MSGQLLEAAWLRVSLGSRWPGRAGRLDAREAIDRPPHPPRTERPGWGPTLVPP